MELYELTVHELVDKLEKKEITSKEIFESYFKRIEEKEPEVGAFVTIADKEETIAKAEKVDKEGRSGKLAGIPIGIKDNMNIKGTKTTCSSKMLENFVSPYNATVIENINKENMFPLGKLNMDEFAMGSSTEKSYFHPTQNPWNLNTVPGGSSGGSAAAVAADLVPWALGSDTGGSIRQPASLCGVVGLKPTYGLVSRYGLVAFASSLDQIGPLTKDVTDSALLLNVLAGHDPKDSTSMDIEKKDYTKALVSDVKGMKIGLPKEFLAEGINSEVKETILNAAKKFEEMGAIVEECSLDVGKESLSVYYIIACAEASSNLGRFDGIRYGYRSEKFNNLREIYINSRSEGFGPEVKRRIILGKKYDLILGPTSPKVAWKMGEISNPLEMYLADIYTVSVNIAGLPGISIPGGVDKEGLPIGVQLIGKPFDEETLLRGAYNLEQAIKFREKYKPEFKK